MPKRSFDERLGGIGPLSDSFSKLSKPKLGSEDGNKERANKERAYIAASRRGDRSIEARMQSALRASEIHRKRTGRGFKITEEIVLREEMYEEEEDVIPRSIVVLGPEVMTSSRSFDKILQAYMETRIAMAASVGRGTGQYSEEMRKWQQESEEVLNRQREVEKNFAQAFPHWKSHVQGGHDQHQRQQQQQQQLLLPLQNSAAHSLVPGNPIDFGGGGGIWDPVDYTSSSARQHRSRSQSIASPTDDSPLQIPFKYESTLPSDPSSPQSVNSSPQAPHSPIFRHDSTTSMATSCMSVYEDSVLASPSSGPFTSEVPPEVRMMMDPSMTNAAYEKWSGNTVDSGSGQMPPANAVGIGQQQQQQAAVPNFIDFSAQDQLKSSHFLDDLDFDFNQACGFDAMPFDVENAGGGAVTSSIDNLNFDDFLNDNGEEQL